MSRLILPILASSPEASRPLVDGTPLNPELQPTLEGTI